MNIRRATENDLEKIYLIEKQCFPVKEAASLERIKKRFSYFKDLFFVIEISEQIAGFLIAMNTDKPFIIDEMFEDPSLHNNDSSWSAVLSLAILDKYQKLGYARLLMEKFIANAKENNKKGCILTCKKELIEYYEKYGYLENGISKSTHGDSTWYDMILKF